LLNERFEQAIQTGTHKEKIHDPERESLILEHMQKIARTYSLMHDDFVLKLYSSIMRESRKAQKGKRSLIGFQGEHGAFSEVAAKHFRPESVTLPYPEFSSVIEEVEQGHLDAGILPVENSLGGAITEVNELLVNTNLKIAGGIKLRINHALLKLPEIHFRDIRVVYSHPQALAQCRSFINRQQLEPRPFYDTAGAARMLRKDKPKAGAVIANHLCAELFNLEIIKEKIQDHEDNFTRFLVLAREEQKKNANKCSLILATPHTAGALFGALKLFADERINLTRIESLYGRDYADKSIFFLDFQIDLSKVPIDRILEKLKKETVWLKYLGCYNEEVFE